MASIFRRSYNKRLPDGRTKRYRSKVYLIKYKDSTGVIRTVAGYTDREATKQRAAQLERMAAREEEGLVNPFAESLRRPIGEHVAEYIADLAATGRDSMYVYNQEHRLHKLTKACEWGTLGHVGPNQFIHWRSGQISRSARTLNQYLDTARAFLNWCVRGRRIAMNPLLVVVKVDTRGLEKRKRRALTVDELRRLIAGAGGRGLVYRLVANTGMRRAEVVGLRWCDAHLDESPAYLSLRVETAKGKREYAQPLRPELAAELQATRPAGAKPTDPVFAAVPDMDAFRADLAAAGIPYLDDQSRQADFHSLRKTFNMLLAAAKTPPRTAMELMRHTDIKLTMGAYTDPRLLDGFGAVASLPDLAAKPARQTRKRSG